jgi:hypothetical protein
MRRAGWLLGGIVLLSFGLILGFYFPSNSSHASEYYSEFYILDSGSRLPYHLIREAESLPDLELGIVSHEAQPAIFLISARTDTGDVLVKCSISMNPGRNGKKSYQLISIYHLL